MVKTHIETLGNLRIFRLFFVLCLLLILPTSLQARTANENQHKIIAGNERYIEESLTPKADILPEGNELRDIVIDKSILHLHFTDSNGVKTIAILSHETYKQSLPFCFESTPIKICSDSFKHNKLITSYLKWLEQENDLYTFSSTVWGYNDANWEEIYKNLYFWVFVFILAIARISLPEKLLLSKAYQSLEHKAGKIAVLAVMLMLLGAAILAILQKTPVAIIGYSWLAILGVLIFTAMLYTKIERNLPSYIFAIFAIFAVIAIYYPSIHCWPSAGFAIERLELARQGWFMAIGGDGRHPFIFTWLLKFADIIFPQPIALHIVAFISTLCGTVLFALHLSKKKLNPFFIFLSILILLLSSSYLKYASETSSFALWFLCSIALYIAFDNKKSKQALLIFITAVYVEYIALLFLPFVVVSYKSISRKFPPIWLWLAILPSIILASIGTITEFGISETTALLDSVGVVWLGLDFFESIKQGIVFLGYGNSFIFALVFLSLALQSSIDNYRKEKDPSALMLLLPVLVMVFLSFIARIRAEYFAAFFPIILLYLLLHIFKDKPNKKKGADFLMMILLGVFAIGFCDSFASHSQANLNNVSPSIMKISNSIDKQENVYTTDESSTRLVAYYSDMDMIGQKDYLSPTYKSNGRTIEAIFSWSHTDNQTSDDLAKIALEKWYKETKNYSVILQNKLKLPDNMQKHLQDNCKITLHKEPYVLYHCVNMQ